MAPCALYGMEMAYSRHTFAGFEFAEVANSRSVLESAGGSSGPKILLRRIQISNSEKFHQTQVLTTGQL